ncbi:MAG: hypothetical protein NTY01_09935, partial [Verrucomicrobia bacterium]|nr:hypothetical protein [Verrucomicrobiota bacterium]
LKTLSAGGKPSGAEIEEGRSVMTRSKRPLPPVAAPAGPLKKRPAKARPVAVAATSAQVPAEPPKTHHHPDWMTTPVVVGAWVMVFVLTIACILAYVHRVNQQRYLDWENASSAEQRQIEDAAAATATKKLVDADDYAKMHPTDIVGIVDRYEKIAEFYFTTTAGRSAKDEAQKWRAKLRKR